MIRRSRRMVIVVAATLLAACGTPAPANREAELSATIVALEATIAAQSPLVPPEQAFQATVGAGELDDRTGAGAISEPTDEPATGDKLPAEGAVVATAAPVETVDGPAGAGVVTMIMRELDLSGEQYAAEGDPDAPLTIVEFSDYG